jgi:hypothetical protein
LSVEPAKGQVPEKMEHATALFSEPIMFSADVTVAKFKEEVRKTLETIKNFSDIVQEVSPLLSYSGM